MEKKRSQYAANLVGAAMLVLIFLSRGGAWLAGWLLDMLFDGRQAEIPDWLYYLCDMALAAIAFFVPAWLLGRLGGRAGLKIRMGRGRLPVVVLLPLFMGTMLLANSLSSLLQAALSPLLQLPAAGTGAAPEGVGAWLLYFLQVCLLAPVLEELLFRGAIQGLLRAWGPRLAMAVTAVLFTLVHTRLWDLPAVLVLGFSLGYVCEVSRSVRPCIILHAANNLFAFAVVLIRTHMDAFATLAMLVWIIIFVVLAFVGAFWALRYYKLGRRILLKRDDEEWGPPARRMAQLWHSPLFALGALVACANFAVNLIG